MTMAVFEQSVEHLPSTVFGIHSRAYSCLGCLVMELALVVAGGVLFPMCPCRRHPRGHHQPEPPHLPNLQINPAIQQVRTEEHEQIKTINKFAFHSSFHVWSFHTVQISWLFRVRRFLDLTFTLTDVSFIFFNHIFNTRDSSISCILLAMLASIVGLNS